MTQLTPDAELLLLILAANGGAMDDADAEREWRRVRALAPEQRAEWRHRIDPLVRAHAAAARRGER